MGSKEHDQNRRRTQPWRQWYFSKLWRALRRQRLNDNPCCQMCEKNDRITSAEVVDHIKPHRGDKELFFDYNNTQSLCERCHNSAKQSEEHLGYSRAIGTDGYPVDPNHPRNREMEDE